MVTRPPQTGTSHLLPFGQLSPDQFERLTLWLVELEGYLSPQHYGQRGKDGGRDIVANRDQDLWYFQCKRYAKITAQDLTKEVDKISKLAARNPAKRPAGLVFVGSCDVPAPTRDTVADYCGINGYKCEFWAGSELDQRVKRHPELLEEFFQLPAERPIPHELPSPPADFTGRERELRKLLVGIASGGVTISGLRGLGGIGKTALALKLGERLKPQFPDGQLYVNLMGFGGGKPLAPAQAQARVITAYHPEAKIPEDPGAVAGLYRSTLSGKRALLLMDNALDAQQVEPLIPPADSVLIVTSRNRFALPGLFPTDLDALPVEDARDLLLKIAPRIGALADEIARLCGRLALALRAAASLIKETPGLEPSEYVKRLADEHTRLASLGPEERPDLDVQASIAVSYDLLEPASQRVLRDLSVFAGSFDPAAAMAVCGVKEHERLDGLVRKSLADFDPDTKRYRLHDLVRLFARSRTSEHENETAARRHALHFLTALWESHRLYKQGGDGVLAALRLFDLEWPNIQAGQAWAEQRAAGDDEAARLCSGYPDAGVYVLDLRQHPRDQIRWLLSATEAAKRLEDRAAEAVHLGNLGLAYYSLAEYRRAIALHEQHLAIAREIGDLPGEGNALGNLGNAYDSLGEYRRAIEFHEQNVAIARYIGDRRGEANALGNLGSAYDALGDHRRAIEFYEQHLAIARDIGDRRGEGNSLSGLGVAYYSIAEYPRAVEFHEQRLAIAREIGDRQAEGQALGNLGVAHQALGEYRRAIEFHEECLAIARQIGDRQGEGYALGSLGIAFDSLGEYRRAIEFYEQALAISREIGDRLGEGQSLGNLGIAYENLGQTSRAIAFYDQQLAFARDIGDRNGEGTALWNLSLALDRLGDRGQAIQRAQASLRIFEEIEAPWTAKVRDQLAKWNALPE